jgi:alpha-galactosidase
VRKYAEMWRISDDFWDHWGIWKGHEFSQGIQQQFATAAAWAEHTGDGHWADADMLPIGHLGPHPGEGEVRDSMFTPDEARTLLTFWSISRSPLMVGANLPASDPITIQLLTNNEVIDVDQNSTGNHPVVTTGGEIIWTATRSDGAGDYLAIVNAGETAKTIRHPWSDLGFSGKSYGVRDLWQQREIGKANHLEVTLAPHASVLYRISAP